MNAQKKLLGLGASILALGGAAAEGVNQVRKAREKQQKELFKKYKKALSSSKKGYEKEANIKQENKQIVNNIAKPEVGSFGIEALAGNQPEEKQVVENKKTDWGAELTALHPQQKQKFILSEEGATYPITAENSQTNIPVDEDVKTLNVVKSKIKQRSAAQVAGAKKAGQARAQVWRRANSLGVDHPEDYEFRNVTAKYDWKEIQALGITKTELKTWAMEAAVGNGNEIAEKVNNRLSEYGVYIDPDQLNTDLYDQIESGIGQAVEMNRMKAQEEERYEEWADNYIKEEQTQNYEESSSSNYSVWDDHPEWEGKTRQEIFDSFVF